MNITIVSHYFSPEIGAPSARIHDLAKQWIKQGHTVDVITGFPNHPHGKLYDEYQKSSYQKEIMDGIRVHRNWTYFTPNKGIIRRTLGHISLWPSARIFSTQKIQTPDVVIGSSPTFFAAMAARGIANYHQVPFIMEVRDLWPGIFIDLGVIKNQMIIDLLEAWELWMYRQADKIVTVTDSFKKNIHERGIDEDKLHVIPNGADINFFQTGEKPIGLVKDLGLEDRFIVLYLGNHGISQALEQILDAAKLLSNNEEVVFLFVGAGSRKNYLRGKAKRENINNVLFLDPIPKDQVPQFYNLSDICLVPLRDVELFKTFIPSKMFEILAVGKPIVASISGEAEKILRESGGAVITPPEDSKAIAEAIISLFENPQNREKMGKNGRKFVEENYSRKRLALKYINMIESCCSGYQS